MEFLPMSVADIVTFCGQAADLKISTSTAENVQKKTGGDIRLIELLVSTAESVAKVNNSKQITDEIAQLAIKKVIPEGK